MIDFSFPELTKNQTVTWICHVDDKTNPKTANYDMIIGLDLMTHIGIVVDTNEKVIKWEGHQCPLKEYGTLQETNMLQEIYQLHKDAPSIQSSTERHDTMLDADYSAPDLEQYCNELSYLSSEERELLHKVLADHPTLFSGGLGTLNIPPIHLELKPDAKPYHA